MFCVCESRVISEGVYINVCISVAILRQCVCVCVCVYVFSPFLRTNAQLHQTVRNCCSPYLVTFNFLRPLTASPGQLIIKVTHYTTSRTSEVSRFDSQQNQHSQYLSDLIFKRSIKHEAQPASYTTDTRTFSKALKRSGCETDHSPHSRDEVTNKWSNTSIPRAS
jgi:hypothetical protein